MSDEFLNGVLYILGNPIIIGTAWLVFVGLIVWEQVDRKNHGPEIRRNIKKYKRKMETNRAEMAAKIDSLNKHHDSLMRKL